jgi:hypothetical protein
MAYPLSTIYGGFSMAKTGFDAASAGAGTASKNKKLKKTRTSPRAMVYYLLLIIKRGAK